MHILETMQEITGHLCWDVAVTTLAQGDFNQGIVLPGRVIRTIEFYSDANLIMEDKIQTKGLMLMSSTLEMFPGMKKGYKITGSLLYGEDTKKILKSLSYKSGPKKENKNVSV